jgi:hypothetical protein
MRKADSIFEEVDRELSRKRNRTRAYLVLTTVVVLFVMMIVFFGGQLFIRWADNRYLQQHYSGEVIN